MNLRSPSVSDEVDPHESLRRVRCSAYAQRADMKTPEQEFFSKYSVFYNAQLPWRLVKAVS